MTRRTFTVVLLGADGAGKTTVAKRLLEDPPMPMKYLYMGPSIESSNIALPTSRLLLAWKLHRYRRKARRLPHVPSGYVSPHFEEHRKDRLGTVGAALRVLHRMAEAWYRQFVAWSYQLRGFVVIYDRHFLFDAAAAGSSSARMSERLYYWFLVHIFPKPDLVILFEAPAETLLRRKGEGTLERLEKHQTQYRSRGAALQHFVQVDATRPLDEVLATVRDHLVRFRSRRD